MSCVESWFLKLVKALNILSFVAGVCGVVAYVILLLRFSTPPADVAIRIYGLVLSIIICITETEWSKLFYWVGFLETWPGRGLVQIFVGVLLLNFDNILAGLASSELESHLSTLFRGFTGHFLISIGVCYVLCGVACLHRIKQEQLSRLRKKEQMQKEKHELETRKQEIEMLLRDTESQLEKI